MAFNKNPLNNTTPREIIEYSQDLENRIEVGFENILKQSLGTIRVATQVIGVSDMTQVNMNSSLLLGTIVHATQAALNSPWTTSTWYVVFTFGVNQNYYTQFAVNHLGQFRSRANNNGNWSAWQ